MIDRATLRLALVTVPVILGLGFLSGRAAGAGNGNPWFDALEKPPLLPPGIVFPIAWSVLYILIGIALALVLAATPSHARRAGLALFVAQLVLNFAWTPLFFAAHQVLAALVLIVVMLLLAIAATVQFARVRMAAAWLMAPYLAWLGFATYLNGAVLALNP